MLFVHLSNGQTIQFDLRNERDALEWLTRVRERSFQSEMRGLTLHHKGVSYSLSRPVGFNNVFMFAEYLPPNGGQKFKGGEKLICQCDKIRANVMIHEEQRAVRINVTNPGLQCYNPLSRTGSLEIG